MAVLGTVQVRPYKANVLSKYGYINAILTGQLRPYISGIKLWYGHTNEVHRDRYGHTRYGHAKTIYINGIAKVRPYQVRPNLNPTYPVLFRTQKDSPN